MNGSQALERIMSGENARGSELFEPLIGSWSVTSTWYDPDGGEKSGSGEWHFQRILGGLGVQDVLFSVGAPQHEYGTTLRTYDGAADVWRVVWMQPHAGEFVVLEGRSGGDEIIQEGKALNKWDKLQRWRFIDITEDSFTWLGGSSRDGENWRLEQKIDARRM